LAFLDARFFLTELHSVVGENREGLVLLTPQLRRDMQWWRHVPNQSNGKPIHKPFEIAYLRMDSSGYGWGAVLKDRIEPVDFGAQRTNYITLHGRR
jgi:hypothetical protein